MRIANDRLFRTWLSTVLISLLVMLAVPGVLLAGMISGTVYDVDTGEPIPFATVHSDKTDQTMAANESGEYRLNLRPGTYTLKFSHLAYYSERIEIQIGNSATTHDIHLKPSRIVVPGVRVSARALGPGQRIILEAIKRKDSLLAKIHSYSFEAYCKLVIRKQGKEDSTSIFMITETQHESHWEYPDTYKEIVTAQRESANLADADAYVTVGEILNFNKSRLDLFDQDVVSPTAEDALDHYNFYLLDTLYIDSHSVFLLEIEPKSDTKPLLVGEIMIADSTYDVVGVDVEFNEAFEITYIEDPRYVQKGEMFEDEFWMPVEIRFECDVELPFPGIPRLFVDYVAVPHQYHFNFDHPEGTFDEYIFEVAEDAYDLDSAYWETSQLVPLTNEEIGGYRRLDSLANAPKPLWKNALRLTGAAVFIAMSEPQIFHFNRVEGTYVGAEFSTDKIIPRTELRLGSGYAFTGDYWQDDYGFTTMIAERRKLEFSFGYHDKIVHRPVLVSDEGQSYTISAAFFKVDPMDYFLEKGFDAGLSSRIHDRTALSVRYHDYNQYSVSTATDFSVFTMTKEHRGNLSITDGKLRSVSTTLNWDSRRLMKLRGRERKEWTNRYTRIELGFEYASPGFIDNDFEFRRYHVDVYSRFRPMGLGRMRIRLYTGSSDGMLPPQRQFTVDFGHGVMYGDMSFKTLNETNFCGDRVAMGYVYHDFGRFIFKKTGLPLVEKIPFSLGLFGGMFWTDFTNGAVVSDETMMVARKAYSEVGFQIGSISPLGFKFDFGWQLSDYDTQSFNVGFGMDLLEF